MAAAAAASPEQLRQLEARLVATNGTYAAYIRQATEIFGTPVDFIAHLERIAPARVREYEEGEYNATLQAYADYMPLLEASRFSDAVKARIKALAQLVFYITVANRLYQATRTGSPEAEAILGNQLLLMHRQKREQAVAPVAEVEMRDAAAAPPPRARVPPRARGAAGEPVQATPIKLATFPGDGMAAAAAAAAAQPPPAPQQKPRRAALFSPLTNELASLPFAEFTPMFIDSSRIRVVKYLNQGTFKTVSLVEIADDPKAGERYAWAKFKVKQTSPDPATGALPPAYKDMWDEVRLLLECRNPYLVNVVGWSCDVRREFSFLMEFMAGGSMREWAKKNGWYAKSEMGKVIARVATAIAAFNKQTRHVHRDLKMDNIFVDERGMNAKIGDLGMALRVSGESGSPPYSTRGAWCGTRGFIPPEVREVSGNNQVITVKFDTFSFAGIVMEITQNAAVWSLSESQIDAIARGILTDRQYAAWRSCRAADPDRRLYSWQIPAEEAFWAIVR